MGPRFRLDVLGEKKKNNFLLISQSKPQFADLQAAGLPLQSLLLSKCSKTGFSPVRSRKHQQLITQLQ
jgi:hypothetical protein